MPQGTTPRRQNGTTTQSHQNGGKPTIPIDIKHGKGLLEVRHLLFGQAALCVVFFRRHGELCYCRHSRMNYGIQLDTKLFSAVLTCCTDTTRNRGDCDDSKSTRFPYRFGTKALLKMPMSVANDIEVLTRCVTSMTDT
jgi:hypothetical protein